MTVQDDVATLMGYEVPPAEQDGTFPSYLRSRYERLGAVESIRSRGVGTLPVLAALIRVIASDDEEEVREAALAAVCELPADDDLKRIGLLIASADSSDRVLTTVLEEANCFDLDLAREIAKRLIHHPDPSVAQYAQGVIAR